MIEKYSLAFIEEQCSNTLRKTFGWLPIFRQPDQLKWYRCTTKCCEQQVEKSFQYHPPASSAILFLPPPKTPFTKCENSYRRKAGGHSLEVLSDQGLEIDSGDLCGVLRKRNLA